MKIPRVGHLFFFGAFVSASLVAILAGSRPVLAVETSGYSFGLDRDGFSYKPHSQSGLDGAFSFSSTTGTSAHAMSQFHTGTSAHAISWASGKLVDGVLRKAVGGVGWVDGTRPLEYFVWSAFATGTELIVDGPEDTMIEFQLALPSRTVADNLRPAALPSPPPEIGDAPVQGVFSDNLGQGFFNVVFEIDVSVRQPLATEPLDQSLFSGTAALGTDGGFSATGDFTDTFDGANVDQNGRVSTGIPENMVSPMFEVEANVPFELVLSLFMTMGDPGRDGISRETVPTFPGVDASGLGGPVGGGGSFVAELRLIADEALIMGEDPVLTFREVPEPTSLSLTLLALLGLCGYRWRRRSSAV